MRDNIVKVLKASDPDVITEVTATIVYTGPAEWMAKQLNGSLPTHFNAGVGIIERKDLSVRFIGSAAKEEQNDIQM